MQSVSKRKYNGIKTTLTLVENYTTVLVVFDTRFDKGDPIKTTGFRLSTDACDLLIEKLSDMRTAMKTRELLLGE